MDFIILILLPLFFVLVGFAAKIHNVLSKKGIYIFNPVDNGNWSAIMFYGLQLFNVITDINLSIEIFGAVSSRHTMEKDVLLAAAVMSVIFLLVPYGLNVCDIYLVIC